MKRRNFLKYLGVGGAGFGFGYVFKQATKAPGAELIPYVIPPEDIVPGVANWYASLCTQCGAGCGVLVRVLDGRAKKVEGNPLHPISRGKLCARGQATVQALYNPDRIKGPLKRTGGKGSGSFTEISWEEGMSILNRNLSELSKGGKGPGLYLLTAPARGHLNGLLKKLMAAYKSPNYIQYELFQNRNLLFANRASMGAAAIPHYDIENTKHLVSFGADFSTAWLSPVNFSYGYGQMRQGGEGRGKLVSVEPRMSLTGANADEWVPVRPGTEGLLALSMAHEIVRNGYYRGPDSSGWSAFLSKYRPAAVSRMTDVSEENIRRLAREFVQTRPSLAIGGDNAASYNGGISILVAVNILNHLAGNIGIKGGVAANPEDPASSGDLGNTITSFVESARAGRVKTLIIRDTNPVFTTPKALGAEEAVRNIPFVVSLSSHMDETTALADLILPSHTSFEDWGDDFAHPSVGYPVHTLMQPAVNPVYNTRGAGDIALALLKAAGANPAWGSFAEYIKDSWKRMYASDKEMSASAPAFEAFWEKALENGGWWKAGEGGKKGLQVSPGRVEGHVQGVVPRFDGAEKDYPYYLVLYPHAGYRDGSGANLSWLQETPDPMTSVVWGSWIEMNPRTAAKLGLAEGDAASVESPFGRMDLPVYLYPGIRPDTVAVPIGQGHSAYGRYAKGRGVNPIDILPAREDKRSGELALNSTRVRISRPGVAGKFVKMEGSTKELGRGIVQTVSPKESGKKAGDA